MEDAREDMQREGKIDWSLINRLMQLNSRTFALTTPMLDENKIRPVTVQYLNLRTLDTCEDVPIKKNALKEGESAIGKRKDLMNGFIDVLKGSGDVEEFKKEMEEFLVLNEAESLLVKNLDELVRGFNAFEEDIRKVSIGSAEEMAKGMGIYLEKGVNNLEDLNEYCYYVAGVVGVYLNKLVKIVDGVELDIEKGISLGKYLQMVNNTKNFRNDVMNRGDEGVSGCLWALELFPEKDPKKFLESNDSLKEHRMQALNKMVEIAENYKKDAINYICSIPEEKTPGYRNFCLMNVLMAMKTFEKVENNDDVFLSGEEVKISREQVFGLLGMTAEGKFTNEFLKENFI
jgi:farnesyl-diphosphate farnesyltransferase